MVINAEKKIEILNQLVQNKNFSFIKDFNKDISNLKLTLEKQKINKYYFTSFIQNEKNRLSESELNQYKNILNLIHDNISYINMINKQFQILQNGIIKYVYNSVSDKVDLDLNAFKLSSIKLNLKEYTKLHKTLLKSINANEAKINKVVMHIKNNLFNDDVISLSKSDSLKNIVSNTYTNSIEETKTEIKNSTIEDTQSTISQEYINNLISNKTSDIKANKSTNTPNVDLDSESNISNFVEEITSVENFDKQELSKLLTNKDVEVIKNVDLSLYNKPILKNEKDEIEITLTNDLKDTDTSSNDTKEEINETVNDESTVSNNDIDIISEDVDDDLLTSLLIEEDPNILNDIESPINNSDTDIANEASELIEEKEESLFNNDSNDIEIINNKNTVSNNDIDIISEDIDDNLLTNLLIEEDSNILNDIESPINNDDNNINEETAEIIEEKEESLFNNDNDDIKIIDNNKSKISLHTSTKKYYGKKHKLLNDNNNLIISEKDKCVYLPYTSKEIYQYIKSYPNFYKNSKDVIKKEFVISIKEFNKRPTKARFNEAYSLLRDKEMCSVFESLKFAFDIMFDYKLHPAIIAACKSLDQLADYLDCLDTNSLSNFNHFNIIFEVCPVKSRK